MSVETTAQTTAEIAKDLIALCLEGKDEEAIARYYSPDIVSIEAMNPAEPVKGMDGLKAKVEWWNANMTVHSREAHGGYANGDQFAVRFLYNVTEKATDKNSTIDEIGVYTVKGGKIVEERFFY